MTAPLRIAMWSGPRNISTAMMRAWENRGDTAVIDEPLYAHYLLKTGVAHPGREQVLAAQSSDWREVTRTLTGPIPDGKSVWYQKHMTQHVLPDIQLEWLTQLSNCFLIRAPEAVVASFTQNRPDAALWELGFEQQARLFDYVAEHFGAPPVLDAEDVLRDPEAMLRALCTRLDVKFSTRMLHWPAGPRASDGVWAKHWYAAVERSTGFEPYRPKQLKLTAFQARLAEQCRSFYERLWRQRLTAERAHGFSRADSVK
ncbi:MAG: HAD family hydrolase [Gammaproteobacteria bacterium]|nr:HAD family hydrolase [Gammaproteobacteria bacterium]MBU6510597.1 HAD family hydrolase [Gammaproteobacteria bacterium]MDE2461325.1 HAD family hydrolase [Gammaproteobacteria bacterium]